MNPQEVGTKQTKNQSNNNHISNNTNKQTRAKSPRSTITITHNRTNQVAHSNPSHSTIASNTSCNKQNDICKIQVHNKNNTKIRNHQKQPPKILKNNNLLALGFTKLKSTKLNSNDTNNQTDNTRIQPPNKINHSNNNDNDNNNESVTQKPITPNANQTENTTTHTTLQSQLKSVPKETAEIISNKTISNTIHPIPTIV